MPPPPWPNPSYVSEIYLVKHDRNRKTPFEIRTHINEAKKSCEKEQLAANGSLIS